MSGTRPWRVIETDGMTIVAHPSGDGNIAVPSTMTVAVDVDGETVFLDFVYVSWSHVVVLDMIRSERDETGRPLGLPTRIARSIAPRTLLAEVFARHGTSRAIRGRP